MFRKLFFVCALALLPSFALAAVTANSVVTAQTPSRGFVQFLNADTAGTYKVLYTGGTNGSKCTGLYIVTSDTATHVVIVQLANVATVIGSITAGRGGPVVTTVASSAITTFAAPISMMTTTLWPGLPVDSDGNPYFILANNTDSIQITFATTVTSGAALNGYAVCSDF